MDLYVVRHAVAHERDPERWPDDSQRPLTPAGEEKFRRAALGLTRIVSGVDLLLSSPLERAWRTAQILAEADSWPSPTRFPALGPETSPEQTALALESCADAAAVAMVGHRPHLHWLLAYLLVGSHREVGIQLEKGGVACMRFGGDVEPGAGELRWLVTPEFLGG